MIEIKPPDQFSTLPDNERRKWIFFYLSPFHRYLFEDKTRIFRWFISNYPTI